MGRDLIKAAEIRATISQVEKYNTAVNTFRIKYNAIPGDIPNPLQFGLSPLLLEEGGINGGNLNGNGNGIIDGIDTYSGTRLCGEAIGLFVHLSEAKLVQTSNFGISPLTGMSCIYVDDFLWAMPSTKLGNNNLLFNTGLNGTNYWFIANFTTDLAQGFQADALIIYPTTKGLTPFQAMQIDSKIDDGKPSTGQTVATAFIDTLDTGNTAPVAGACFNNNNTVSDLSDDNYFVESSITADSPGCNLRIRANF